MTYLLLGFLGITQAYGDQREGPGLWPLAGAGLLARVLPIIVLCSVLLCFLCYAVTGHRFRHLIRRHAEAVNAA